jgi:hypothetical protein
MTRSNAPDYRLDAPGVVRNLSLVAAGGLLAYRRCHALKSSVTASRALSVEPSNHRLSRRAKSLSMALRCPDAR